MATCRPGRTQFRHPAPRAATSLQYLFRHLALLCSDGLSYDSMFPLFVTPPNVFGQVSWLHRLNYLPTPFSPHLPLRSYDEDYFIGKHFGILDFLLISTLSPIIFDDFYHMADSGILFLPYHYTNLSYRVHSCHQI